MDFIPYLTAAIMLLGILVGTLISPRIQHSIGKEYNRKDLIFQKKFKYFESVIETIETNKKMYYNIIQKLNASEKNSQVDNILEDLKKNRKKFFMSTSSLYLNPKIMSEKIVRFVRIEKDIFNSIQQLKGRNKEEKARLVEHLKIDLKNLNKRGLEILYEMRKELTR